MRGIKRILAPTDFSEASCAALDYAFDLASLFKAELIILHVIEESDIDVSKKLLYEVSKDLEEDIRQKLEKRLKEQTFFQFEEEFRSCVPEEYKSAGVFFRRLVRKGIPFLEIIKAAKEEEADLIIMGTHGRTGLKSMLIGSVAEKVVRNSPNPVLTVRRYRDESREGK